MKFKCKICPEECHIDDLYQGRCGCGKYVNNGSLSSIQEIFVEPIKKKPFRKFLEGTDTLSLGFTGCNLECKFCENHDISQNTKLDYLFEGEKNVNIQMENLKNTAKRYNCKSVSFSYTEPSIWYKQILNIRRYFANTDLKFALKTNAYVSRGIWEMLCNNFDAINIDWKGSEKYFKNISGASHYVIEDRLDYAIENMMRNKIHVEVSVPMSFETVESAKEELLYFCNFLSKYPDGIPIHILRISKSFLYKDKDIVDWSVLKEMAKDILYEQLNDNNVFFH